MKRCYWICTKINESRDSLDQLISQEKIGYNSSCNNCSTGLNFVWLKIFLAKLQQIKNIGDVLKADSKTVPERNDRETYRTCVVNGFITIV